MQFITRCMLHASNSPVKGGESLRRTAKADDALSAEVVPMARQVLDLAAGRSDEDRQTVGRFLDQLSAIVDHTADGTSASPPDRTH